MMVRDTAIFGLRFGSNPELLPSDDDLRLFLESKKEGTRECHRDDIVIYWKLLASLAAYRTGEVAAFGDRILYSVLDHSGFINPALKSAVEQYKYHLNSLAKLDFRKPAVFIKSTEEEMSRISSGKKQKTARSERMTIMVEQRKLELSVLKKKRFLLAAELDHLIDYVRQSLDRIEKLCEQSICILVREQIDRKKELSLIEDIKAEFRERLRQSLQGGTITKEQMETAKERVAELSKKTADLVRSDIYAMTQLYEAIHEHAGAVMCSLGSIAAEVRAAGHDSIDDDILLYRKAESELVTLVNGRLFEIKAAAVRNDTEDASLLIEKRSSMLEHLVNILYS